MYQLVLSFLTALPALLVFQVPALGPNGVIDTIRTNCQKFLEGKWSHLYQAAIHLQTFSSPPHCADAHLIQQSEERLFRLVHQLVPSGNISAAYQRLTQPGLFQPDPLPHFLQIH